MPHNLTPWFPHTTQPVRSGVYEVKADGTHLGYAHWDHKAKLWGFAVDFPKFALPLKKKTDWVAQNKDWRGIAE